MQRTYVDQFGRIITEQLRISEIMAQIAVVAYILVALSAIAWLFQCSLVNTFYTHHSTSKSLLVIIGME